MKQERSGAGEVACLLSLQKNKIRQTKFFVMEVCKS